MDTAAASFVYEAVAKDLVWKLKFAGGREAALLMARQMRKLLPNDPDTAIVPVPTATGRARRRGYDQAKLLARELSRQTRLPYCDLLARGGQAHQVGSRRQQRLDQLTCAYRTKRKLPRASCYVLVDDVITTGATIEAAATTLLAAGAIKIQAIAYARPKGVRD